MSASTRPWGLEYEVNKETLSTSRRVSLDTWPCRKLEASGPVNLKIPKCARCAQPSTAAVAIDNEMGAAAAMSTPGSFALLPETGSRRGYGPLFSGKLSCVTTTCDDKIPSNPETPTDSPHTVSAPCAPAPAPLEIGGRSGPDPTRYGDWELRGRCIDF